MSPTSSAAAASGGPDLGRVDQILVLTTLRSIHDGQPSEAFAVSLDVAPDQRCDEESLLGLLSAAAAAGPRTPWTLAVTRTHAGTGADATQSRSDVRLDLVAPAADLAAARDEVRALVPQVRALAPGTARRLDRDEALERARDLVGRVWPGDSDALEVSDEQRHPEVGGWTLGLAAGSSARFEVEVAAVEADPRTVHLRRREAAEVSDSIGVSG
jgi:hypothetical protein